MLDRIFRKKTFKPASGNDTESPEQRAEFLRFLKLAMDTERQGLKFYSDVKRRIDDYNMNKFMDVIMEQEKEHLRIVTEIYNAEKKSGIEDAAQKAAGYKKQKPLRTPLDTMKHLQDIVKKKTTIYDLFQKAVEFEQDISRLYADMAAKTKNAKVKAFLKKLSDEELMHKDFLMMHQDSIYNTGHWFGWDHVRLET
ncbi:ferritin family protein [Candidatus Woesearchaeota archaeon]|nr:ferritin family protein [Candidatus Woesearchaeota archaeon]